MGKVLEKIAGRIKVIRRKWKKKKNERPKGTLLKRTLKREKKKTGTR
jgi:hypothetical protein